MAVTFLTNVDQEELETKIDNVAESVENYTETDPTVPAWAKAANKPTYTASEVGALSEDSLPTAINTALAQAKASGEFDGADGKDGKDGVDGQDGYTPVKGVDYFDGKDGNDGNPGADGKDGTSPVVSVSAIEGGHRITITDTNGTNTVDVLNGTDGQPGKDGADGAKGDKGDKGDTGATGARGEPGKTPVRGTDYWTAADIAEIKSYVDDAILGGAW